MREYGATRILGWVLITLVLLVGAVYLGIRFVIPRETVEELRSTVGLQEGTPERHLVPEDYRGWVKVKYGVAGRPALLTEDGVLVFRYPESGVLETSSGWNGGIKRKQYRSYGPQGTRALFGIGPNRSIWGEYDLSRLPDDEADGAIEERSSGFFVGTRAEYRQADRPFPHLLPGSAEPETGSAGGAEGPSSESGKI